MAGIAIFIEGDIRPYFCRFQIMSYVKSPIGQIIGQCNDIPGFDTTYLRSQLIFNQGITGTLYRGYVRTQLPMIECTLNHTLNDAFPTVELYNTETTQYVDKTTYDIEYVSNTQVKIKFFYISEFRKIKAIIIGKNSGSGSGDSNIIGSMVIGSFTIG